MGRPLKHASSKPQRSMRQGNIAARVAKGNLGPTSATGYYNAFSPTESGKYVVYKMLGASQAPLSFTPQNDDEFISLNGFNQLERTLFKSHPTDKKNSQFSVY